MGVAVFPWQTAWSGKPADLKTRGDRGHAYGTGSQILILGKCLLKSRAWQPFPFTGHFRWVRRVARVSCKNMKAIREHEAQIIFFTSEGSGCNPSFMPAFMLFKLYSLESHSVEILRSRHRPCPDLRRVTLWVKVS